jgi:predicted permease
MRRLLLKLLRRRRLERDLEAELAFHREMAQACGNAIVLGNPASIKEEAYDLWRFNLVENLWRDLVYSARGLRRSPALVCSALLSLALGTGVNTALFSIAVEFLLSEPSVRDSASVVAIRLGGNSHARQEHVEALRESGIFLEVTGAYEESFVNWNDGTETRQVFAVQTTSNYFSALGVPVAHGRGYGPADAKEVVVLQHNFWRRHFHSDPGAVGRALTLEGRAYTIVGILPENHRTVIGFGFSPDIYMPVIGRDTALALNARLKPGATIGEALAAVTAFATRLDTSDPGRHRWEQNCSVTPIAGLERIRFEKLMRSVGLFFVLLQIVVGLVLLISCVNVASLLLARASTRRREIAVRLSLGAGRARLMQQLLVESLLLALGGAALGFALAQVIASLMARIQLPLPVPVQLQIEPDWRVAIYAAALAVLAAVASGLLPAWQTVREAIAPQLHREQRFRLRRILVTSQIAISLVVLATGFLFVRNLVSSRSLSPGFDVRKTVRADVYLPRERYRDKLRILQFADASRRALQALPGVEAVAAARIIPFTDNTVNGGATRFPDNGERRQIRFAWNAVTPDYFRAMNIPIHKGRDFTAADRGQVHVVAVNTTFVERFLAGREPIGTVFLWGNDGQTPMHIVAVVGGTKTMTIGEEQMPQVYEPLAQISNDRTRIQFVLRSAIPPAAQLAAVRQALRRVEAGAAVDVSTLYSSIGFAFLPSQIGAVLLGSMGLLGLMLAMIGLYGMLAYSVVARTPEIGLRLAMGATRGAISRLVLLDAVRLLAIGSAIGLFVAFFVTNPLAVFLVPGVNPGDPWSFSAVLIVFALTGLAACLGPMRRAVSVDPLTSLRYE